jgi:hypothetical protein
MQEAPPLGTVRAIEGSASRGYIIGRQWLVGRRIVRKQRVAVYAAGDPAVGWARSCSENPAFTYAAHLKCTLV